MGRKWRNGGQFRPLFEVFLKKIGFWVVDVWECVLKKVVFCGCGWSMGGRWMVDGWIDPQIFVGSEKKWESLDTCFSIDRF
jgi:hypothetical protein